MKKFIIFFSLLLTPVFVFASIDNNLYYGLQKNSDVKQLQEFLIDKGFLTGSATGNFFSLTLKAIKAYQTSANISPTGYVGTLTRRAINDELAANLSSSNQEATTETGSTPPAIEPAQTLNDVVKSLQAQIALLTQQLAAMQSQSNVQQQQQTTLNQIQQNTQQIAQNTASPATFSVSCFANPSSTQINQPVTFISSVSGGTGSYAYSWIGACISPGQNCSKSFSQAGNQTATLIVTSGSQTKNTSCSASIVSSPPTDNTPPIISSINTDVGDNYATIIWTTNELSTSEISFGTDTNLSSTVVPSSSLFLSHNVNLPNLTPATPYWYKIVSRDASGNIASSPVQSFTIKALIPATLSVEVDNSTTPITQLAMGMTGQTLAIWKFTANEKEDIKINQIQVTNTNQAGSPFVRNLKLITTSQFPASQAGTPIAVLDNNNARFINLNITISKNSSVLVTLTADIIPYSEGLYDGNYVRFKIDVPGAVNAIDQYNIVSGSGNYIANAGAKIANEQYIYKNILNAALITNKPSNGNARSANDKIARLILRAQFDVANIHVSSIAINISGDLNATNPTGTPFYLKNGNVIVATGYYTGTSTSGKVTFVPDSPIVVDGNETGLDIYTSTIAMVKADTVGRETLSFTINQGSPTSAGDITWDDQTTTVNWINFPSMSWIHYLSFSLDY